MEYQYRLLEPNESDYKQAVIEKGGITASFTIAEVEAMQERNKKAKREADAQVEIEKAKIVNVEHFHPEVKDMPAETLAAAAVYFDAKGTLEKSEQAVKTCEDAIAQNDAMLDQVKKQFGFDQPVISPIQPHGEADQQNNQG